MATVGSQLLLLATRDGDPTGMGIGPTLTWGGRGSHTKISVGLPTIMVAGCGCMIADGSGCLDVNGDQPGFPGVRAETMSDGRLYRHALLTNMSTREAQSRGTSMSRSISDRRTTTLSMYAT